jgi:hypothetical protein
MPALIDLKTNLKSLGYGNDRPGNGSSNQPYIVTPIPDREAPNSLAPDFLLRNGYLSLFNAADDVERVGKYFIDLKSPSGLLFIAKQELLERQNPKLVNIDRFYNPLSTLLQVGFSPVGFHFNKQGISPYETSYYDGGRYGYYFSTRNQTIADGVENRLTIAYTAKIAKQDLGGLTINPFGITREAGDTILLSYPGGPGSVLGIGNTNIRIQNPSRQTQDISTKFQPSYYSTLISNPQYLIINNGFRPSINWEYDFLNKSYGVSSKAFIDLDWGSFEERAFEDLFPEGSPNFALNRDENTTELNPYAGKRQTLEKYFIYGDNLIPVGTYVNTNNVSTYALTPYFVGRNADDLTDDDKDKLLKTRTETSFPPVESNIDNNTYTFSYAKTLAQSSKGATQTTGLTGITDFRATINEEYTTQAMPATDYTDFNREKTYNASATNYRGNYIVSKGYQLDPNEGISSDLVNKSDDDLVEFRFTTYNASNTANTIYFRAYLEDWNDSYKAEWNGIKYMGRAEQLYKYAGFSRDGSVNFNVPVLSKLDLGTTYARLNSLVNTVAPYYSTGTGVTGLLTGVITKITMGDYWKSMPVLVKDIGFTPINDMGWDIGREVNGVKRSNEQLPKGIKVNMNFTIIHNYVPQYGQSFIIN